MRKLPDYVPLRQASRLLGVKESSLRAEAERGTIPVVRVGNDLLFNMEAVAGALADIANKSVKEVADAK